MCYNNANLLCEENMNKRNNILIYTSPRLNMSELAEFLGVNESTVQRAVNAGKIKFFRSRGIKYILMDEVKRIISEKIISIKN